MYKAIILDLDDTLYAYESLNEAAVSALQDYTCNIFGVSAEEFSKAYGWARNETKKMLGETGASHNRILYCQKTLEYLGKRPTKCALDMYEAYWGYMLKNMVLREGVLELLEYCADEKIKIGICSDLTTHIQHRKLRQLGITNYVDAIVTSEEAGAEKPAPVMFKMILSKLGVNPEDALYVGDSLKKDIMGAEAEGIKALWLSNKKSENYKTISSFDEIKGVLNGSK